MAFHTDHEEDDGDYVVLGTSWRHRLRPLAPPGVRRRHQKGSRHHNLGKSAY